MTYSSLQQIKDDFQITADDSAIILDNLKSIRNQTHPDRSQGDFQNEADKERHVKANNAIEYIEKMSASGQLTVVEQMVSIVKQVVDILPAQQQQTAQSRLENRVDYRVSHFRSPMAVPKITLTGLTAFLSVLFIMPNTINDHQVLKNFTFFQSTSFVMIWMAMLVYTAIFWIIAYIRDESSKRKLERVKMESLQNSMFAGFVHEKEVFGKDELTMYIILENSPKNRSPFDLLFRAGEFPVDVAQALSETIISRAERNKVITKIDAVSLSDSYMLKQRHDLNFQNN